MRGKCSRAWYADKRSALNAKISILWECLCAYDVIYVCMCIYSIHILTYFNICMYVQVCTHIYVKNLKQVPNNYLNALNSDLYSHTLMCVRRYVHMYGYYCNSICYYSTRRRDNVSWSQVFVSFAIRNLLFWITASCVKKQPTVVCQSVCSFRYFYWHAICIRSFAILPR